MIQVCPWLILHGACGNSPCPPRKMTKVEWAVTKSLVRVFAVYRGVCYPVMWGGLYIYGMMIGHYKDPYERNSMIECHEGFVAVAQIKTVVMLIIFWWNLAKSIAPTIKTGCKVITGAATTTTTTTTLWDKMKKSRERLVQGSPQTNLLVHFMQDYQLKPFWSWFLCSLDSKFFVPETPNTQFLMVVSIGWFQIITQKICCFTKNPLKTGCLEFQVV